MPVSFTISAPFTTELPSPVGGATARDYAFSPSLNVIVIVGGLGSGNIKAMRSANGGLNWTFHDMPAGDIWTSVVWSPSLGKFFACNPTSTVCKIASSVDGITWVNAYTNAVANTMPGHCIEWSPELGLLIVGARQVGAPLSTSRFMTSPDGTTWTLITGTPDRRIEVIRWSPALHLFVAADGTSGLVSSILTSPDGTTWTLRNMPDTTAVVADRSGHALLAWADDLGLFVLVRSDGSVIKSPDGINWSVMAVAAGPAVQPPLGVVWAKELGALVFSGQTNATKDSFQYSDDGLTIKPINYKIATTFTYYWPIWDPVSYTLPVFRRLGYTEIMMVPPPPTLTITAVVPPQGDVAGNTTVEIVGTNFDPDIEVVFDHLFPLSLTWVSATSLIAVTPPHALGPVTVTVTNPDDSEFAEGVDLYEYIYDPASSGTLDGTPPEISWMGSGCHAGAISPDHGTMVGGTPVTIYGTGFIQGSTVYFGGLPATSVVIDPSGTFLTCHTPAHQTGDVDVEIVSPRT